MTRVPLLSALALGLVLGLTAPALAAPSAAERASARSAEVRLIARQSLEALSVRSDSSDSQWFANGVWHSKDTACWFCADGPGTLAATLWRVDGMTEPGLFRKAVATFDATIAAQQNPNGSFGDERLPNTQFFGNELGTTYLLLGNRLDARHRATWKAAIAGAADYLIGHGDLTWEANGNIDLGNTELEWLAWAITGKQRFHDAYELSWKYTIDPPQSRWPGYGLHVTAGSATSSTAAGYLAESGGGKVGFDPEYTMLQLSVASRAYLLSHDPRFLWLSNLLWNQLSPLVKRPSWHLDASGGTRRSLITPVTTPGIAVLATVGGRRALLRLINPQTAAAVYPTYLQNARQDWGNASLYRGYGNELGVVLLALATPPTKGVRTVAASAGSGTGAGGASMRLSATVSTSGVRLAWRPIGSHAGRGGPVDVLVDGHLVRTVRGAHVALPLSAGLYQISLLQNGLGPRTSTTITVPAS